MKSFPTIVHAYRIGGKLYWSATSGTQEAILDGQGRIVEASPPPRYWSQAFVAIVGAMREWCQRDAREFGGENAIKVMNEVPISPVFAPRRPARQRVR